MKQLTTDTKMSNFAINVATFGENHAFDVMTGGAYPFVSICMNGVERVALEPEKGLKVYEYVLTPPFTASGIDVPEQKVQVVTNFGGLYEYVQVLGLDGEELFCHEARRGVTV